MVLTSALLNFGSQLSAIASDDLNLPAKQIDEQKLALPAQQLDERRFALSNWQIDEKKFALDKARKDLLRTDDELEHKIADLKKQIKYLNEDLDASYKTLKETRQMLSEIENQFRM